MFVLVKKKGDLKRKKKCKKRRRESGNKTFYF